MHPYTFTKCDECHARKVMTQRMVVDDMTQVRLGRTF